MADIIATSPFTKAESKKRATFSVFAFIGLARQRRQLAGLDEHQLADIGISRTAAKAESARPVWDVPNHWTR